jgi:uncharacterized protein YkwD
MKDSMRSIMVYALLAVCGLSGAPAQGPGAVGANLPVEAEHLFAQANQARMEAGAPPLHWDAALAAAALAHCRLMVAAVQIGHRYQGEPDLAERAGAAGAHFGLIEENVAAAPSAAEVHNSWMHSPGHRKNLLNPEVDRVGIVVIASRGELYAVADYTRAVPLLVTSDARSGGFDRSKRGLRCRPWAAKGHTRCGARLRDALAGRRSVTVARAAHREDGLGSLSPSSCG